MNKPQSTQMLSKEKARNTRRWYLLDAKGKTLGRFAPEVAKILKGKHRTDYTPHVDCGDGVIVINAGQIKVTGSKEGQKTYYRYTGFMGGLRAVSFREMLQKKPTRILEHAIKGMLPKTRLGRKQMKKLRLFAGAAHKMDAQKPLTIEV